MKLGRFEQLALSQAGRVDIRAGQYFQRSGLIALRHERATHPGRLYRLRQTGKGPARDRASWGTGFADEEEDAPETVISTALDSPIDSVISPYARLGR
jgi:hypothetical protein